MAEPRYRYVLSCKIADHSGNLWVSVMDDQAGALLDIPAVKMKQIMDEGKEKEK